jgi:hypothetical protein
VGKLRNLRMPLGEIQASLEDGQVVQRAADLLDWIAQLQPFTTYLAEAQANLPADHAWSTRASDVRHALLIELRHMGRGEEAVADAFKRSATSLLRQLEQLKRDYIAAYADLHRHMRLGPAADRRREQCYRDPRYTALKTLAQIDMLEPSELEAWERAISALIPCPDFYEGVIQETPTCPHCDLRPAQAPRHLDAEEALDALGLRLDTLLQQWRQALCDALDSPAAQQSREAMTPTERTPLEAFLAQPDDATAIPEDFAAAATQALRGIQSLTIETEALITALRAGGMPCTPEALRERFETFVTARMRGHSPRNTRLMLKT